MSHSAGRPVIRSAPRCDFCPVGGRARLAPLNQWSIALAIRVAIALMAVSLTALRVDAAPLPGFSMSWGDCAGGPSASQDLAFACGVNIGKFTLVCSLAPDSAEASIIGAELVVDLQSSDVSLPDWWRFDGSGTGGCRAGALSTSYDFSATPGCTDAWLGQAFGGPVFSIGPPDHPSNNQARIKVVATVTSDHAVTLSQGVQYGVVSVVISAAGSTGVSSCAGCAASACLVLNSILLRRLPSAGADSYLVTPASAGSNWATWQGTGADCAAVPVRRHTWGQIKSLYR